MKGVSLPVNAVIIIALAAVVLLVLSTFFLMGTGPSMSNIEAQRVFEEQCPKIKCEKFVTPGTPAFGGLYKNFFDACQRLYGISGTDSEKSKCFFYCNCGALTSECNTDCTICKNFPVDKERCFAELEKKHGLGCKNSCF
ncbi:MAG: hypothetical protein J4473_03800 [Candidatus Aenigmarchaeota archaeon]|nr:hypothetical protein [Candidatus Aenigmarchaeota archaeon]